MATWDDLHLGLAGWCKVVGSSRDVLGCPMATLGQLGPGTGRLV